MSELNSIPHRPDEGEPEAERWKLERSQLHCFAHRPEDGQPKPASSREEYFCLGKIDAVLRAAQAALPPATP